VEVDPDLVVLGLLADRRDELGQARTQAINRNPPAAAGTAARRGEEVPVRSPGPALIAAVRPRDIAGKTRRRLAAELITELEAIDRKIKACKKEITVLVQAQDSTLLQLHGIGPSSAARLLADVGNIHRFASRDHFASWNGTAPLDASSGQQQRHRLSRAGNRRINAHCTSWRSSSCATRPKAAPTTTPKSRRETPMEAMRCLKRRLSNVVYRQMLRDQHRNEATSPGGHPGTTPQSSVTDLTPDIGSSDKPLPGPATSQRKTTTAAAP
jgi:transposase